MKLKSFTHVSASQIDTWLTCRRKWWFHKIMGLPIPQAASAALGEAVHAGQETYLDDPTAPETVVHPLARASLPLLRTLRGGVFVEHKVERHLPNGLTFVGKIDVLDTQESPPLVLDWKTGNPNFFKTADDLRSDVQMIAYAREALLIQPSAHVRVAHFGIPTKGKGGGLVEATLSAADVDLGWGRIVHLADQMKTTAEATQPGDVTPTPTACMKYGRPCAFFDACNALAGIQKADPYASVDKPTHNPGDNMSSQMPYSTLKSLFGDADDATLQKMMKMDDAAWAAFKTAEGGGAPTVTPKNNVRPPEAPSSPREVKVEKVAPPVILSDEDKVRLLLASGWTEAQVNSMPDETFALVVEKKWAPADVAWDEVDTDDPEQKDIVNVRVKAPPVVVVQEVAPPARRSRTAAPEVVAPVVEEKKVEPVVPVAEEPKRRGRPLGAKNKATLAAEAAEVVAKAGKQEALDAAAPDEEQNEQPNDLVLPLRVRIEELEAANAKLAAQAVTPANLVADDRFVLYVDCAPETTGIAHRHLDDVLKPFMEMAAKNNKNDKDGSPNPVTHYSLLSFNRGPGVVAAYVLASLPAVAVGTIVVDSRSPCAAAVLEVLRPVADLIVSARGR